MEPELPGASRLVDFIWSLIKLIGSMLVGSLAGNVSLFLSPSLVPNEDVEMDLIAICGNASKLRFLQCGIFQ